LSDALERYRWIIAALLAIPLLGGTVLLLENRLRDPGPLVIDAAAVPADIRVYITGAVRNPGVYPVPPGSRWIDVLDIAGGPGEDADLMRVNLARRVQDEDQIIVPSISEPMPIAAAAGPLININTAGASELETLRGIGAVRAERIIQSRVEDGPFQHIEELLSRKLIPESVFNDIAAQIITH
jgi:competence protein ComEA